MNVLIHFVVSRLWAEEIIFTVGSSADYFLDDSICPHVLFEENTKIIDHYSEYFQINFLLIEPVIYQLCVTNCVCEYLLQLICVNFSLFI